MRKMPIVTCLFLLAGAALGQEKPAEQPASPLAGPKVSAPEQKKTLAQRDMEGRVVRLETRPEAAALDLLSLTPEERIAVDKVLTDRAALVSKTLFDNMEICLKVQNARQAGDRDGMPALMREFREAAEPLFTPSLLDQLAGMLPEAKRAELRSLVKEYLTALAEDQENRAMNEGKPDEGAPRRGPGPDGRAGGFAGGQRRAEMNLTIRELAQTLAATVAERRERTEALFKAVNATPEQESKITAILRGPERPANARPDPAERGEMMRKIMEVLTPAQRKLAAEHLRNR
ncbi:hypothetical protein PHYC_00398 [Phycisphaerales bacterium]|nr:hypothetical protein PHYC_00398 [Phycisphaerales bacterium]